MPAYEGARVRGYLMRVSFGRSPRGAGGVSSGGLLLA
jgi:hypothetical protein